MHQRHRRDFRKLLRGKVPVSKQRGLRCCNALHLALISIGLSVSFNIHSVGLFFCKVPKNIAQSRPLVQP